jgi:predicted translin family RNA/ssDNA-binding protein
MQALGRGLGDTIGETRRTDVTEVEEPSILFKIVAVSVVQGVFYDATLIFLAYEIVVMGRRSMNVDVAVICRTGRA